jgi:hypothetical protein
LRVVVCAFSSLRSPRLYISSVVEKLTTHCKRAFKKSARKFGFWTRSECSVLRAILGSKINFFDYFFKHYLHLILRMIIQKNLRNFVKGLKLNWKNIVRFSSPTASGTNLRSKYQHFGLSLFFKTSRTRNSVYKYDKKKLRNLNFKGSKLTREAKNPILIAIIF